MRALISLFLAAFMLAGCCVGGYPPQGSADQPPFSAFQAGMKLGVGMPTDVAMLIIGSRPVSSKATNCGVAGGYEWPCQVLTFGCCEGNQLVVYIAPSPDGRGAVNSWSVGKSGATWG
jgi:hypothetical protein